VIVPRVSLRPNKFHSFPILANAEIFDLLVEKPHILGHEHDVFHKSPNCQLTDVQAERVKALAEVLSTIAQHDMNELLLRR